METNISLQNRKTSTNSANLPQQPNSCCSSHLQIPGGPHWSWASFWKMPRSPQIGTRDTAETRSNKDKANPNLACSGRFSDLRFSSYSPTARDFCDAVATVGSLSRRTRTGTGSHWESPAEASCEALIRPAAMVRVSSSSNGKWGSCEPTSLFVDASHRCNIWQWVFHSPRWSMCNFSPNSNKIPRMSR